jgi:hypothetical protein
MRDADLPTPAEEEHASRLMADGRWVCVHLDVATWAVLMTHEHATGEDAPRAVLRAVKALVAQVVDDEWSEALH